MSTIIQPRRPLPYKNGVDLTFFRKDGPSTCHGWMAKPFSRTRGYESFALLGSLALLAKSRTDWTCTIIGGGLLEKELKEKNRALGLLSCVRLTGHVQDVHSYMDTADLAVLSLNKEGLPLFFVEAMACGTPVIGLNEAGIRESVIDGITGILVDRDASQIAAAITQLQQSKETRAEMSRQAAKHVRAHWTWERTVDRYEEEVQKVLNTRTHPALPA